MQRLVLLALAMLAVGSGAVRAQDAFRAPTGTPVGSDAYTGIYANDSSTPRLFLIRDGRYVQFEREWDDAHPGYEYAYQLEDAYDYSVINGAFSYRYTDTAFDQDGWDVTALTYRGAHSPRVYTLRQLVAVNEWDAGAALDYLSLERGLSESDANALLDDPVRFDRAVREADTLTFADLAGVE